MECTNTSENNPTRNNDKSCLKKKKRFPKYLTAGGYEIEWKCNVEGGKKILQSLYGDTN